MAVEAAAPGAHVRLRASATAECWVFVRLTHEIPSYRGVKIGDRVRLVDGGEPADYAIEADGRLTPLR